MIVFEDFSLQRGGKPLFDVARATIQPGERVGLIGANGAGKSSLFALMQGKLHTDAGEVRVPAQWRIAHVAQETPALARSALDFVLDGDTPLRAAEARIAEAQARGDGAAEAEAHAAFADVDGYTAPARAEALLLGLGFTLDQTRAEVGTFSGGWRMRLNLAQALMCPSDLLLLDEPTNHLDLDAIVWLEDWLARYPGTLLAISHDREFLDAVCTAILHIEHCKLTRYSGNYSAFESLSAERLALQQAAFDKQQQHIAHLQSFITRFKAKASKAKQAQSRVKALEKLEKLSAVQAAREFSFAFRPADSVANPMLSLEAVDCGYPTTDAARTILRAVTLSIQSGQRIGLLGANGQGKSTFIKTLAGTLAPLAGRLQTAKGLQVGYFAQHQLETLQPDDSALEHLMRRAPSAREQELRSFLGGFNFRGDMATTPIAPFSGGEKARLALALIVWEKPNLLLLDEPTNHLDLETREALVLALAQFDGTLIVVSHDRHLLRATTDQFLLIAGGEVHAYEGDLDDYRTWLLKEAAQRRAGPAKTETAKTSAAPGRPKPRLGPLTKALARIEAQLDQGAAAIERIETALADPALYTGADRNRLTELLRQQAQAREEQERLETRWLELQTEIEAAAQP